MALATGDLTRANARSHLQSCGRTENAEAGGARVLPVSSHFDVVLSAARIEVQLAGHQFHQLRNRRSHQRLTRAIASWRSVSGVQR
jgi:hypothetical protein